MRHGRLAIVGGSDAGISAALRARELDDDTEIVLVVADSYPNFSICGLPFYVSGETPDWRDLAHRSIPEIESHGITLLLDHRAERIDARGHQLLATTPKGTTRTVDYDRLDIATGADPHPPAAAGHRPARGPRHAHHGRQLRHARPGHKRSGRQRGHHRSRLHRHRNGRRAHPPRPRRHPGRTGRLGADDRRPRTRPRRRRRTHPARRPRRDRRQDQPHRAGRRHPHRHRRRRLPQPRRPGARRRRGGPQHRARPDRRRRARHPRRHPRRPDHAHRHPRPLRRRGLRAHLAQPASAARLPAAGDHRAQARPRRG